MMAPMPPVLLLRWRCDNRGFIKGVHQTMNQRGGLTRYARLALLLVAALAHVPGAAAADAQRPNIVFIFSDDHAYQAISAYNDPRKLINTPNIDRLAAEGMLFNRCIVPNSICGPSRATILTGKYSHMNGFYNNSNSRFDGSQTTFPKLLQSGGYQTAIFGKWHLVSDPTGFDHWHILPGQGLYYNPPMIDNGKQVKHEGYTTDIITDLTLDWLKHRDKSKPFMLMCQHKAPHREWEPALRHLGHDNGREYAEPETLFDDYSGRGLAEHDQDMTIAKTMNARDVKLLTPGNLTPEQRAKWDAYYEPRNKKFKEANLSGDDLVRWRYQRVHARLPGLHQGGGRERRPGAQVSGRRRPGRQHDRGVHGRSGLLSRRARLVRQAVDFRRIAADAAFGSLAGRDQAGLD